MWDDIITDLNANVTSILARIKAVLQFYKGYNVSTVINVISLIESSLSNADQNLSMISVEVNVLSNISTALNEVWFNCVHKYRLNYTQ